MGKCARSIGETDSRRFSSGRSEPEMERAVTFCNRNTIAYYITAHGFGHAVRSLEIIRNILEMRKDLEVVIVSDLPDFLIEQNVGRRLSQRRKRLDVGLVQQDSLPFDLEATLRSLEALHREKEALVAGEVEFLKSSGVGLVVSDISFLPFVASNRCGLPNVGIGNFTWDWIYASYAQREPRWAPLVEWIGECCRACEILLQLPMHGDCSACPHVMDVPLVARKIRRTREDVRRILGVKPDRKAFLLSFVSLDLDEPAQRRVEALDDFIFLFKRPLDFCFKNALSVDGADLSYTDVVAAMDAVITKPGYGITSDCLVSGVGMIYTDRGFFPEYEILVDEIEKRLPAIHIPSADLYAGKWEKAIRGMEAFAPRAPSPPREDGAAVCARIILERGGWGE